MSNMITLNGVINKEIIKINLWCNEYYDDGNKYKVIIKISDICDMSYVWIIHNRHNVTILNLINKIRKVFNLNIEEIKNFNNLYMPILSVIDNKKQIKINQLIIKNNNYIFELDTIINNDQVNTNQNILKFKIVSLFNNYNIDCPLQCNLIYNEKYNIFYNDIPNKSQLIQFINNIDDDSNNNTLFMEIFFPQTHLTIYHNNNIFHFYKLKNELLLFDDKYKRIANDNNNNNNYNYMDILNLLNIKKGEYTFNDINNKYFELDVYQEIDCINNEYLYTKPLKINNNNDRCVICQQDFVCNKTKFTRINSCHHIYHFSCIKQYLQYINKQENKPQCPLCRKEFNLIQVHNDMVLQTLQTNHHEFVINDYDDDDDDDDDDVILFSDLEEDINNNNYLSAPQISELDEFYRIGLVLINSNSIPRSNGSSVLLSNNEQKEEEEEEQQDDHEEEEEEEPQQISSHGINRTHSTCSFSTYSTDQIGRLSLSNVSTSATIDNNEEKMNYFAGRPSLRYIYSPKPLINDISDDLSLHSNVSTPKTKIQINPFNILETKTISRSFSNLSSTSTLIPFDDDDDDDDQRQDIINNNNNKNNNNNLKPGLMKLFPIDSLQSINSASL